MLNTQVIRFIIVGIVNTIFGYSLYALFIYIGLTYIISILFSTILGLFFNFKTIGNFVFNSKDKTLIRKFFLVYIIVFIMNILLVKLFKIYSFDDYISGLLAVIPIAFVSFMLNKYYVFKEKRNENY